MTAAKLPTVSEKHSAHGKNKQKLNSEAEISTWFMGPDDKT
jgi:hypothetical protein